MKEFSYLNYYTVYSCDGDLKKPMSGEACFGHVFKGIRDDYHVQYKVILYKGVNFAKEHHASNACLFTKEKVRKHLSLLKSLYPFHYKVLDYNKKDNINYDRLIVFLELKEVPKTFHKYALTWLRYTYEYPYNVILKDTYLLKEDPIFRFESISNIFNLVLGCFFGNPFSVHQIAKNQVSYLISLSELKERIKQETELNYIYNKFSDKLHKIPADINSFTPYDIEYWENGFEIRKPIYIEVYKNLKR